MSSFESFSKLQSFVLDDKLVLSVALGAVGLVILFVLITAQGSSSSRRKSTEHNVIIMGQPDSGKTAIFTKLVYGKVNPTHTSITPSSASIPVGHNKTIRLSDVPGHPRLKESAAELISQAHAAVLVCDVSAIMKNGAQVAEQLPEVLCSLAVTSLTETSTPIPRLLILAHKADLMARSNGTSSKSNSSRISSQTRMAALERLKLVLTREMDRLKSARSTVGGKIEGMDAVPSGSSSSFVSSILEFFGYGHSPRMQVPSMLGNQTEEEAQMMIWGQHGRFKWEEIEGVDIEWAVSGMGADEAEEAAEEESISRNKDGLKEVRRWLAGC